jgi:excisionase family DNA binding protein
MPPGMAARIIDSAGAVRTRDRMFNPMPPFGPPEEAALRQACIRGRDTQDLKDLRDHEGDKRPVSTLLMTVDEVADLFRTSRKATYSKVDRGQLPGVTKIGRRRYFRRDLMLDWLSQKCAPSPKEM